MPEGRVCAGETVHLSSSSSWKILSIRLKLLKHLNMSSLKDAKTHMRPIAQFLLRYPALAKPGGGCTHRWAAGHLLREVGEGKQEKYRKDDFEDQENITEI